MGGGVEGRGAEERSDSRLAEGWGGGGRRGRLIGGFEGEFGQKGCTVFCGGPGIEMGVWEWGGEGGEGTSCGSRISWVKFH